MSVKLAVAQWRIGAPARFDDFAARVEREVAGRPSWRTMDA